MTHFSPEAEREATETLGRHAHDLAAEALRIAKRAEADAVSASHVRHAAGVLRLQAPNSRYADILLALGTLLAGLAGGVGTTLVTAPSTLEPASWLAPTSIALACIGTLLIGAGIALKLRR